MRVTSLAATCAVATVTLALPATLVFASPQGTDATSPSPQELRVADDAAQDVLTLLAETYETAHDEVFVTGDAENSLEVSTEAVAEIPTTTEGEKLLLTTVSEIAADASDPTFDLSIDETRADVTSEPVVKVLDGGSISITSDLTITRHISEHDVEWVEIVPHEVTVSPTGDVTDVVVHDLEQQLEESSGVTPQPAPRLLRPAPKRSTAIRPTALSATNRSKVSDYAEKYAITPNKNFKEYATDCTNFVSQAMYAGGWKEKSHPWIDYKWDTAWWYGGVPNASWSWTSAEHFYRMSKALDRTTTAKYITDLRRGDLLQYKKKTSSSMNHSMVVTKRVGSEVYLSFHTGNTLNKPFSKMRNYDVYWFGHHV